MVFGWFYIVGVINSCEVSSERFRGFERLVNSVVVDL